MTTTNKTRMCYRSPVKQLGGAAVEFALVGSIFFILFFGIVELARAMYLCNTLQEVTRRAAALAVNTDFSNEGAMQDVRERAIFRSTPGVLLMGDPISDRHVRIDYLRLPANSNIPVSLGAALPANPLENRVNCAQDMEGARCIRLVRVRICMPGGGADECDAIPYVPLFSLIPFSFALPFSTTIATVETLGMPVGVPCEC